jgi:selenide, water dikinase
MGPSTLAQVLRPLAARSDPRLIVGLQTSDDAAVYAIRDDLALIQTVDFFSPIVDDPYLFGQIAAANSLSDIFAMGGDVLFALNIAAFPEDLPSEILSVILEGGADKVAETNAVIAGGHTVTDPEPKYGLVVTGTAEPQNIWTKAGARPGDALYLTKPLGTGIITTAHKRNAVDEATLQGAVAQMATLNLAASRTARSVTIHACTDITGFGLLGHAWEMATKSNVSIEIDVEAVPVLAGAIELARLGNIAGGLDRNREYYSHEVDSKVQIDSDIDAALADVLFDPQTSGGLLFSVPRQATTAFTTALTLAGVPFWNIGQVDEGSGVNVKT